MFIIRDKNDVEICKAQNVSETYNAFTRGSDSMKTQLFITIEHDRDNGVTLANVVKKFTEADLTQLTVTDDAGTTIDTFTEFNNILTITKTLQNGGMNINITLITSEAAAVAAESVGTV